MTRKTYLHIVDISVIQWTCTRNFGKEGTHVTDRSVELVVRHSRLYCYVALIYSISCGATLASRAGQSTS